MQNNVALLQLSLSLKFVNRAKVLLESTIDMQWLLIIIYDGCTV